MLTQSSLFAYCDNNFLREEILDTTVIGRITLLYHSGDIDQIVIEEQSRSKTVLTDREKETAIKAHGIRHVKNIVPDMVLSRAIISLPRKARLIFVQQGQEK